MKFNRTTRPISVWRPIDTDTFLVGTPHYPEHVAESYWDGDAERMAVAGFNTVRMAEFAWHLMEPREDVYDFDLFDRAIEGLARHGIKTIMCTPTATPPRWLTQNYPEVLRVDVNGRPASHGSRQHADTTSPVFRLHSRRITRAMTAHYRDNPNVIGWQTDNELNTSSSTSYSAVTRREFQKWVEVRYGAIGQLNEAWGGDFWATAYDNFDQIVLPMDSAPVSCSPGHVLDYHRFLAFATARFQSDQVKIIREINDDWFVFHNVGRMGDIDFRGEFTTELDFMGYDIYPMLHDEMHRLGSPALVQAQHLDVARGHTGNFIVPEQQSGFGSQPPFSTLTPEPGEMRRMAWSSVSRGADGVLFFRWRPAHFGAEIYWMGIIDHDNIPRRRYDEATQFATESAKIAANILGTHVRMDVGIAGGDFDNQEAHRTYEMGLPSPHDDALILYRHCYESGISVGFIHPEDDLSKLKVLYVPHWVIWEDKWTAQIEKFAEDGGTVILGARIGSRTIDNQVIRETSPGHSLTALSGVKVEEFGRIAGNDAPGLFSHSPLFGSSGKNIPQETESHRRKYTMRIGNETFEAAHVYEDLSLAPDTKVLGEWSNRFLDGRPSIASRKVGKGHIIYVGTYMTPELARFFDGKLFAEAGVAPLVPDLPAGIEVSMRVRDEIQILFVLNTTADQIVLHGVPKGNVLVSDAVNTEGSQILPGFGVHIVEIPKKA